MIGTDVVIALEEIVNADADTAAWLSRPVPRRPHLIVTTSAGKTAFDVSHGVA